MPESVDGLVLDALDIVSELIEEAAAPAVLLLPVAVLLTIFAGAR